MSEQPYTASAQETEIFVLILCCERLIVPGGGTRVKGNAHPQTPDAMFAVVPAAFMGMQSIAQAKQRHFCSSNIPDTLPPELGRSSLEPS